MTYAIRLAMWDWIVIRQRVGGTVWIGLVLLWVCWEMPSQILQATVNDMV